MASKNSLKEFLSGRRTKGTDFNITGIGNDTGKYVVSEEEYDTFLRYLHTSIFGNVPKASSLLEKHRNVGPVLIDLDLRYETGGPLVRKFQNNTIKNFIAEYVAAMVYFSKVETLENDI